MLESTSKVYVVSEFGGQFEDAWETVIGVCSSLELANQLKAKALSSKKVKCGISEEELQKMLGYLMTYEEEHNVEFETEEEGLKELFPDKNPQDIDTACWNFFTGETGFTGIDITEVDFYL